MFLLCVAFVAGYGTCILMEVRPDRKHIRWLRGRLADTHAGKMRYLDLLSRIRF